MKITTVKDFSMVLLMLLGTFVPFSTVSSAVPDGHGSKAATHIQPHGVTNIAPLKGGNPNPQILPPNSYPYGKTYGEWAVRYWQWILGISADRNPAAESNGEFCTESQSGPVWLLAWSFGTSVNKSCKIPAGKAIFTPVYNWIFGAGVYDCAPSVPDVPCNEDLLWEAAKASTDAVENTAAGGTIEVTIDGVPVKNITAYRASSPGLFSITYPTNSVTGLESGTYYPQVADGYWLMLAPLPVGGHDIKIYVYAPGTLYGLIEYDSSYHIEVVPGSPGR